MADRMIHVFRNSPLGRENLLQAAYFCQQQFGTSLSVYVPASKRFVMDFPDAEVIIELDDTYTQFPDTAHQHAREIAGGFDIPFEFHEPDQYADKDVPIIPVDWTIMSCPRVISEKANRIGLGHIGPKVRGIVKHAPFPVFIPALAYKTWDKLSIFFGGSKLGAVAVGTGIAIARLAQVPFTMYTQLDNVTREKCEATLADVGLLDHIHSGDAKWELFEDTSFEEHLYAIPHDSLAVVGAAGDGLIKELLFGSKLETIQSTLANPLVVVGPNCQLPADLVDKDA